ncbi:LysR family transcriptional regulator [Acidisoma cellulosilytica]|uniref:LysR family transcriptional regulator n=1 Tax=Acidisoma cellulosilyticum TaxID=2802395 RepID=A0A963Z489_9PROT|nr:LysR substrate-binding domain-containing protein [Acidisoma cellulosilyticum]MCB8882176.1 LysR family transcriptional regulator [Acidisoma cellulosilyticum]
MAVPPSLRSLQAFEAAARLGSFVSAADELAVSPAAVSQLVRGLEEQIARQLFNRVNRSTVLTEAGRELFLQVTGAFGDIRTVSRDLSGGERRSSLVISVAQSVAMGWLSSRLPDFMDHHGAIDISLRGEDDPVPFERSLIDIRLSYGQFYYREHVTEEIAQDCVYPVCAPAFLERYGPLAAPEDLLAARLIHTDWGPSSASFPTWKSWFDSAGVTADRDVQRGMTANSSRAALDLAIGGLGVALGQGMFCAEAVEAGQLVVPVGHVIALDQPYCLTIPVRSAQRSVVMAFKTWLATECVKSIHSPALRPC